MKTPEVMHIKFLILLDLVVGGQISRSQRRIPVKFYDSAHMYVILQLFNEWTLAKLTPKVRISGCD